jgi:putative membrane protein
LAAPALCALVLPGLAAPFGRLVAAGDLFIVQLGVFVLLYGLLLVPAVRRTVIPAGVQRGAAERLAREQFFTRGLHLTEGRTGVLIFVSVAEHYVEILADAGVDAKVPQHEWQSIVDGFVMQLRGGRVADGFTAAVAKVGAHLAAHFPAARTPNELPDHLFVI